MKNSPSLAALAAVFGMLVLCGCGSAQVASNGESDIAHMRMLGALYGRCFEANNLRPPANQDQFIAFLNREPEIWSKTAATPQELLTSPRDGEPLVVIYGAAVKDPVGGGFPWIAHEKTGVDGKQLAVNIRGNVELKDSQDVAKLFPSS